MSIQTWWASLWRRCRRALAACPIPAMLTGAGVLMGAGLCVRTVSGSPYARGMMLHFGDVIPPVLLMGLLWMVWYGVLGATLAATLCCTRRGAHAQLAACRGSMLLLCMIFLGFFWYPLFFAAEQLLLALLLHLIVLALCVLSALCYFRYFRAAAIVLFCHAVWLAWLAVVSIRVVFL